ncbi:DEAD/DEAH box helicase [uncultured Alistipes sp.]|uniref:DEAD/DEAH box helicase n=2 Tax=uncultured Alistipes sp. TaxID=538949 RepID=UPI0025F09BE9|nr:DEAD/DEAH box helicase [uncultured Alistipes sp.]
MRFDELELEDEILDGLEDMNFQEMTPVQEHTIPVILEGRDIIGCAQTGTGKTAAYTLPLLNRLLIEGNDDNVIKAMIIVPTRELAQQIDQQFQGFSYYLPISTTVVYGGGDGKGWDVQKNGMLSGSDVVIATPGRMISHIQNSGIDLSHVEYLILDEADRMLDMGFSEDIMKIVSYMPKARQTIMFSATLPPKIREMAKGILRNPAEVNIAISKPNEAIDQSAYICYENQKLGIIQAMFAAPTDSKTIIFSSSKLKVKELAHTLKRMKLNVAAMHSDLEQAQREEVMLNFRNNKISILVATDIVARGIDVEDIGMVINYDVPHDPEDYIHRIGRTARAAATGAAVTFVSEDEQGKFHAIEKFIDKDIRKAELPENVGPGPVYNPAVNNGRGRGRGGRPGRSGGGRGGASRGGARDGSGRGASSRAGGRDRRKESGAPQGISAGDNTAAGATGAAKTSADGNHATGRGEGNRGSRDRKRRRGGRNRNRGGGAQGGGETPQA